MTSAPGLPSTWLFPFIAVIISFFSVFTSNQCSPRHTDRSWVKRCVNIYLFVVVGVIFKDRQLCTICAKSQCKPSVACVFCTIINWLFARIGCTHNKSLTTAGFIRSRTCALNPSSTAAVQSTEAYTYQTFFILELSHSCAHALMRSHATVHWRSCTYSLLCSYTFAISRFLTLVQVLSISCDLQIVLSLFVALYFYHIPLRYVLYATLIQLLAITNHRTLCCSCSSLFIANLVSLVICTFLRIQYRCFIIIATFVLSALFTLWSQQVIVPHFCLRIKYGT